MKLFGKDLAQEVAIVAEIGVNHEGDPEAASRLLSMAAEAGADAVKFQSYTPARYVSASDPERLERVSRFALGEENHRRLAARARELGVAFFSTPLTEDWVPRLAELGAAIKIASGDLTFEPTVRAAARTGKPVILSTGLGTVGETDTAVGWLREEIGEPSLPRRVVLMHCVSAYPTPVEQANVRSVPFLAERYGLPVGYSNHVVGPEACLAAVALGAVVLEAHFTDRKSGRSFRDHELSFEPDDLAALVEAAPRVRASLGTHGKARQPCEEGNVAASRKGVVAARDLTDGTRLVREDLMFARPATGIAAGDVDTLIGRATGADIHAGETIMPDDLAPEQPVSGIPDSKTPCAA